MKKLLLFLSLLLASSWLNAQNYNEKEFQQTVSQINNAKTKSEYEKLFQKFVRFSSTKPSEKWLAYYYAAVSSYLKTEIQLTKNAHEDLIEYNSLSDKYINGALNPNPQNPEANILLGLILLQRIQINKSQSNTPYWEAISQITTTMDANTSNNPRLTILKAKIEETKGDKEKTKELFQKAFNELNNKTSNSTSPKWGKQIIQLNKESKILNPSK